MPKSLAGQLRKSLSVLEQIPGLALELTSPEGTEPILKGHLLPHPAEVRALKVSLEGTSDLTVVLSAPVGPIGDIAEVAVRSVLDRIELESRESSLLDELSANWESLEALYEISTEILRFGDLTAALRRLVDRFVSLQEGLRAVLMLGRSGKLEVIVSSHEGETHFEWSDLGPVEAPIRESRSIVFGHSPVWGNVSSRAPWLEAAAVAAAPISSRKHKSIGLLLVWRPDGRAVFDAPFSRLLEAIAYQASMLLESDRLNRAIRENERLAQEIEIASSIQQTLLMGNPPVGVPMIEIAACSAASQHIDGDFHDFIRHGAAVDVLIGDVMGKGVAAALLGAATKLQFLRAIANLSLRSESPAPRDIVRRAASRLSERLISVERFVTLCYARFDPPRSVVEFVDCGHTGILMHRKKTGETRFLRGEDLPLGVTSATEVTQCSGDLMAGDTFLLFSDGVTETKSPDGTLFGEERLIDALETWSSLGPEVLLHQIRKMAAEFRSSAPQSDDFTCVAVRIVGAADVTISERSAAQFVCSVEQLEGVRRWLRDTGSRFGLDPDRLNRLETAGQEAFVNCIRHGSLDDCLHPIRLEAELADCRAHFRLLHQSPAFDPLSVPLPAFDGSRDGGFGTFIIMRSADELEYRREGDVNMITVSMFRG